jgi:hypothetical protein
MDIHQARTESIQEQMKAKIAIHQANMKSVIYSIRPKLETIKHWVQEVLLSVNQKKQGLCKELIEKTDETQVDLWP